MFNLDLKIGLDADFHQRAPSARPKCFKSSIQRKVNFLTLKSTFE